MENKYNSRVPLQRIAALVIMDMMSILLVSFAALYIRYDFSFQDIDPMFFKHCENLLIPNIIGTLFFSSCGSCIAASGDMPALTNWSIS